MKLVKADFYTISILTSHAVFPGIHCNDDQYKMVTEDE